MCAGNKVLVQESVLISNGPKTEVIHTEISNPYPETLTDALTSNREGINLNPIVVKNFQKIIKGVKKGGRSHSDNGCVKILESVVR